MQMPTLLASGRTMPQTAGDLKTDPMTATLLTLQRSAGNRAVAGLLGGHAPLSVQRGSGEEDVVPKASKPDDFLITRIDRFQVDALGDEYVVVLDRKTYPWHARYERSALHAVAFAALVQHVYREAPDARTIIGKVESLGIPYLGPKGKQTPVEVDRYDQLNVDRSALEDVGAALELRVSERGEQLRRSTNLGAFLKAAFVDAARRWGSLAQLLPAERLRQEDVTAGEISVMLRDTSLRQMLTELAKTNPAMRPLVQQYIVTREIATGRADTSAANVRVMPDAELAVGLLGLAGNLKRLLGKNAKARLERERVHRLNEFLRPHPIRVKDVATYILEHYDPGSSVTVNFLGPVQLEGGQRITNAKGHSLLILAVSTEGVIYQNEHDKRLYRQELRGVEEELKFGVYALASEKLKHLIPLTKFLMRVTGALFPPIGYLYLASNVLNTAHQFAEHQEELRTTFADLVTSGRNIERRIPGLMGAGIDAAAMGIVGRLFDPRRFEIAWEEWIIVALKIIRKKAVKIGLGDPEGEAVSYIRLYWEPFEELLNRITIAILALRATAAGVGRGTANQSRNDELELAKTLAGLGLNDAIVWARKLLAVYPDGIQQLAAEIEEFVRSGSDLLNTLKKAMVF
jgi:hypothetical protein